jgi:hypothetical protein
MRNSVFVYLLNISLVGSVVIDAELCSIDHDSMTRNCDQKGLKPLDAKTDSRTKLN